MAGTGLVAGEVVVDALPYFDQGYEAPGVREAVSSGYLCSWPSACWPLVLEEASYNLRPLSWPPFRS